MVAAHIPAEPSVQLFLLNKIKSAAGVAGGKILGYHVVIKIDV
jgi:hypothetical protein